MVSLQSGKWEVFDVMLSLTPNYVIEEDPRAGSLGFPLSMANRIPAPSGTSRKPIGEPR